ncbi:hypothetical protein PG997_002108 [Apiospora hydei]|uniref:Isoamyl alcohol n=1 Tax=Apiospora hydei TaxID=1337664 RepID=A0ABR1X897_9PEZI
MAFKRFGAAVLFLQAALQTQATALGKVESCACDKPTVRYVVVDMPPPPANTSTHAVPVAVAAAVEPEAPVTNGAAVPDSPPSLPLAVPATPIVNATRTFTPITPPGLDCSKKENIIPSANVSLYYGAAHSDAGASTLQESSLSGGLVNLTLAMSTGAVALEYIDSVTKVDCSDDSLTVSFSDSDAYKTAFDSWSSLETLFMITNHLGNCDVEFERGFFKVDKVAAGAAANTITCSASKEQMPNIAESCEMTFSSIPTTSLTKRLTVDPSVSLAFNKQWSDVTLYEQSPYVKIAADEARLAANVTFSGTFKYSFLSWKLEAFYFDLDTALDADLQLSAYVAAGYANSFRYAPDSLAYNLVDVPGVVTLGPGVAFGIGLDLATSAGVNVTAGAGISLPDGNVHLDLKGGASAATAGWQPQYTSFARISERGEVQANVSASVTVQLALKFLGGLVDLSSGLTAEPAFNNRFVLDGAQSADTHDGLDPLSPTTAETCGNGVQLQSDFLFALSGFITKYWSSQIWNTEVPIVDKCYYFNGTQS